jgi:hypothetical protein
MKRPTRLKKWGLLIGLCAGATLVWGADAPQTTDDGLQLKSQTKSRVVYLKPGATFSQFGRVAILDVAVEFKKGWQDDYNRGTVGLDRKVRDDDIERMKGLLAGEFKRIFTDELQNDGGYQVVTTGGPDVLILRPALINVVATAPDIKSSSIDRTIIQSAGSMTLYLELWDANKNILARVMDAKADTNTIAQPGGSVTNKAAADRIIRSWAQELRKSLDSVKGNTRTATAP